MRIRVSILFLALLPAVLPACSRSGGGGFTLLAATFELLVTGKLPPKAHGAWSPLSHPGYEVYLPSGQVFHNKLLLRVPGGDNPFALTLSYHPDLDYDGPYGRNMRSTLSTSLEEQPNGDVIVTDAGGAALLFPFNGAGFDSPPQCWALLVAVATGWRLTAPNRWVKIFDLEGKWVGWQRPDGQVIDIVRDANHRVLSLTTPEARTLAFEYDPAHLRLLTITDWAARAWRFVYDRDARLVGIDLPLRKGETTPARCEFGYNASHDLTFVTNPAGQRLGTVEYDAQRRVSAIRTSGGDALFSYDTNMTKITARSGFLSDFEYDANGLLTKRIVHDGSGGTRETTYAYDALMRLTSQTRPLGDVYRWDYLASTDPRDLCNAVTFTHQPADFPATAARVTTYTFVPGTNDYLSETNTLGHVTNWTYDAQGNLATMTLPAVLTEAGAQRPVYKYTYSARNLLTEIEKPDGAKEQWAYATTQPLDRIVRQSNDVGGIGRTVDYEYDVYGNITREVYGNGTSLDLEWGAWNELLTRTDAGGNTTTFTYDIAGNPIRIATGFKKADGTPVGTGLAVSESVYNEFGQATTLRRRDAFGGVATVLREYRGGHDRVTRVISALGVEQLRRYDCNNRLVERTRAANSPDQVIETFEYDANGNTTKETNGLGIGPAYVHDGFGRVTRLDDGEGVTVEYTYDALDRVLTRVVKKDGVEEANESYQYDDAGNKTASSQDRFTDPLGPRAVETTRKVYDLCGRVVVETDPCDAVTRYTYDGFGQRTRKDQVDLDRVHEYSYNSRGNLLRRVETRGGRAGNPVVTQDIMTYDGNDNLLTKTNPLGDTTLFEYDSLDRPCKVTYPEGDVDEFVYDANGEVLVHTQRDGAETLVSSYVYDAARQLVRATEADGRGFDYAYDRRGNNVEVKVNGAVITTRVFDAADRMTRQTDAGGVEVDYQYDARGFVSRRTTSTGIIQTISVDSSGNITGGSDNNGGTGVVGLASAYDSVGNRTMDSQNGLTVNRIWDNGFKPRSLTTPDGFTYEYGYDDATSRIKTVKRNGSALGTYEYMDGTDMVKKSTYFTQTSEYEYDAGRRRTRAKHTGSEWLATYDRTGRRIRQERPDGTVVEEWEYDGFQRLARQKQTWPNPAASPRDTTMVYESGTNRLSSIVEASGPVPLLALTTGYDITYDPQGRMHMVGTMEHTYDASGNASNAFEARPAYTKGEEYSYEIDALGRVKVVRGSDGRLIGEYLYDPLNRPVLAREEEFSGALVLSRFRLFDGCRLITEGPQAGQPGFNLFYVPDLMGSGVMGSGFNDTFFAEHGWQVDCAHVPRALLDFQAGTLQERYDDHNPWGTQHFEFPPGTPFRGTPGLNTAVGPPAYASSWSSGIMFGWTHPPSDPNLPRRLAYDGPLPPGPGGPGGGLPFLPPGTFNPVPGDKVFVLKGFPDDEGYAYACDQNYVLACGLIRRLQKQEGLAFKLRNKIGKRIDGIAQNINAINNAVKAKADAVQGQADAEFQNRAIETIDNALDKAMLLAGAAKLAGKLIEGGLTVAKAVTTYAAGKKTRVARAIKEGTSIAQNYKAVGEGLAEAGTHLGGKAIEGAAGLDLSLMGSLGVGAVEMLTGRNFGGEGAKWQKFIDEQTGIEGEMRNELKKLQEDLNRLLGLREVLRRAVKNVCKKLDQAMRSAGAWRDTTKKRNQIRDLKQELARSGVR